MGSYRLSRLARRQIRGIGRYTLKRFGDYQARAYHAGLERTFGLLADFPKIGAEAGEWLSGARRFRFQSHARGVCARRSASRRRSTPSREKL
ncbi:MAG: type II toxin-antitoxin system RelE/ParE family toxin [Roseiarcus sp.]